MTIVTQVKTGSEINFGMWASGYKQQKSNRTLVLNILHPCTKLVLDLLSMYSLLLKGRVQNRNLDRGGGGRLERSNLYISVLDSKFLIWALAVAFCLKTLKKI